MKVYQAIARELDRARRGRKHNDSGLGGMWEDSAEETLSHIEREILPSGSGFDSGTTIDRDESTAGRIVLKTDFHHMNDSGYYDGWTSHRVILTPDWEGFSIRVTGKDKRGIKEYIGDTFHHVLTADYKPEG